MLKLIKVGLVAVVMAMGASSVWAGAAEDSNKGHEYFLAGNYREAAKWIRKAAEQGHDKAQNDLGGMYFNGQGLPQDYREAAKWWRKAAGQGYAKAQFNLGTMYYLGQGLPQGYVMAYMWFNLAASSGDEDSAAKLRDKVAKRMTFGEIAAAQRLASACFNSNYRDCE